MSLAQPSVNNGGRPAALIMTLKLNDDRPARTYAFPALLKFTLMR